ncbi:MAG: isoprenylcysteine carboxylmethyltransferase family protein [Pseudomonadota bacterium]
MFFLIIRRHTENISTQVSDWAFAVFGTFAVLLVRPGGDAIAPVLSVFLMLVGTFTHITAKLTLRRSFGLVAANRGVRATGLYAFVRHPMYAGYLLTHIGFFLLAPTAHNAIVYAAAWTAMVGRIIAEEKILSNDEKFRILIEKTRWRLVPGVY